MVVPPASTTLANRVARRSRSDRRIAVSSTSWTGRASEGAVPLVPELDDLAARELVRHRLEKGLGELLAMGGGIVRRFREQDGVLVHLGVEVDFGANVLGERWMRGVAFIEGLKKDWAVVTSHHVCAAVAPTKCR